MNKIRKWLHKPKKSGNQLLSQFFYADEELSKVAAKLESLDEQNDGQQCSLLVSRMRSCQDSILNILNQMMNTCIPEGRANRDFWVKFPEEIRHDSLGGQLWFGAECLAAGSIILNQEVESVAMRPLALQLTSCMEEVRCVARHQALKDVSVYPESLCRALRKFDHLMAEFELRYVSAMVPVRTVIEYDTQQDITVLFCETATRALKLGYISQTMIDEYEPALMITIPRLAIVCGLLVFPDGPLLLDRPAEDMSELFSPFISLLRRIRDLLKTLKEAELQTLERKLCAINEEEVLVVRRRSSAVPLTMASNLHLSTSSVTASNVYAPSSSLHVPSPPCIEPSSLLSTSSLKTPNPTSSIPMQTSGFNSSPSPIHTTAIPVTIQMTAPISKSETPISGFVFSPSHIQQQRDEIQNQARAPSHGQEWNWSSEATGDREERPFLPPLLEVPDHMHPDSLHTSVQSDPAMDSGPNSALVRMMSYSVKSDVKEMEQLSRMFHQVEDEMNSFLWPPSQNSSPALQRRRSVTRHTQSSHSSPGLSGQEGMKSYCSDYSSSPSLSPNFSPRSSHESVLNHDRSRSLLRRGGFRLRSSNSPSPSPTLNRRARCNLDPNQSPIPTPRTSKACSPLLSSSSSSSSSLSSPGPSSPVGGNLSGPVWPEGRVFAMEDLVTQSMPSSPFLGAKQKTKQEMSPSSEPNLKSLEDVSSVSSISHHAKVNTAFSSTSPLLQVKQRDTSLPSSLCSEVRHPSSLPCSPLMRVRHVASSCPSSPRVSLSRQCIEAALERSKNLRSRGGVPVTPDLCSRRKPMMHDSAVHLNRQEIRGMEEAEEKWGSQEEKEEEEEDVQMTREEEEVTGDKGGEEREDEMESKGQKRKKEKLKRDEMKSEEEEEEKEEYGEEEEEEEGDGKTGMVTPKPCRIKVSATVIFNPTSCQSVPWKTERDGASEGREDESDPESDDSDLHNVESQQPRCPSAPPLEEDLHLTSVIQGTVQQESLQQTPEKNKRAAQADRLDSPQDRVTPAGMKGEAVTDTGPVIRMYPSLRQWNTGQQEETKTVAEEKSERSQLSHRTTKESILKQSDIHLPQNNLRSRFRSSDDLLHRLFVCISGIADQLQTNYASDLRAILKTLFDTMTTRTVLAEEDKQRKASVGLCDWTLEDCSLCRELLISSSDPHGEHGQHESLPFWVPDESCSFCTACSASFSVIRRKHHCRSCGKIFCSRCSAYNAPLPRYRQVKPVRVCTHCYLFHVTPFCRARST